MWPLLFMGATALASALYVSSDTQRKPFTKREEDACQKSQEPEIDLRLKPACDRLQYWRNLSNSALKSPACQIPDKIVGSSSSLASVRRNLVQTNRSLLQVRKAHQENHPEDSNEFFLDAQVELDAAERYWTQYLHKNHEGDQNVAKNGLAFALTGLGARLHPLIGGVMASLSLHRWFYQAELQVNLARKEKLIQEGFDALVHYEKNPTASPTFDFGSYFLRHELTDNPLLIEKNIFEKRGRLLARLQNHLPETEKDPESSVKRVMEKLFAKHLNNYARELANYSDFYEDEAGNCEAQTKMIVDAMFSSKIRLSGPRVWGVQSFRDHIQVVIFNKKTKEVWNLMTGERNNIIQAPIYDPHVLIHATLLGLGGVSPMRESQFLIAEANVKENPRSTRTKHPPSNTKLKQIAGQGEYNPGPIPERTKIRNPYERLSTQGNPGELLLNQKGMRGYALDELAPEDRDLMQRLFISHEKKGIHWGVALMPTYEAPSSEKEYRFKRLPTIFKDLDLMRAYNQTHVRDPQARTDLLTEKLSQEVKRSVTESPQAPSLTENLLNDPKNALSYSAEDIHQASAWLERVHILFNEYTKLTGQKIRDYMAQREKILGPLEEKRQHFCRTLESKPEPFLEFILSLPAAHQGPYIQWLTEISRHCPNETMSSYTQEGIIPAVHLTGERGVLLGKGSTQEEKREVASATLGELLWGEKKETPPSIVGFYEVDLKESDFTLPAELLKPRSVGGSPPPPAQEGKQIPFTLFLEMLKAGVPHELRFTWTPAHSEEFKTLNVTGKYDKAFLHLYSRLKFQDPKDQTYLDPFFPPEKAMKFTQDVYEILHDIKTRRHMGVFDTNSISWFHWMDLKITLSESEG